MLQSAQVEVKKSAVHLPDHSPKHMKEPIVRMQAFRVDSRRDRSSAASCGAEDKDELGDEGVAWERTDGPCGWPDSTACCIIARCALAGEGYRVVHGMECYGAVC